MDNRVVGAAVAAVVLGLAGCSKPAVPQPPLGLLPAGTAQVSVGGQGPGTSYAVECQTIGPVTTIYTGDDGAGTTSAVDESDESAPQYVMIDNIGGFTGSFWQGVDGEAEVDATGRMYTITGTATGIDSDQPSVRAVQDFEIKAAC